MANSKHSTLRVRLPADLVRKVEIIAAFYGTSVNDLVEGWVDQRVANYAADEPNIAAAFECFVRHRE
jgi:hypothetical protein